MFARWDRMAKQFARIAKDINMAVKAGGSDPNSNPALRRAVQNSRALNMPKDKVDAAIKRASGKDAAAYEQIIYEGYAPHGVAMIVEVATDNPTRTVAQVRAILSKGGGNLGSTGRACAPMAAMVETSPARPPAPLGSLALKLITHAGGASSSCVSGWSTSGASEAVIAAGRASRRGLRKRSRSSRKS